VHKLALLAALSFWLLAPYSQSLASEAAGSRVPGAEQNKTFDYQTALATSQAAIGNPVGDYRVVDSTGMQRTLTDFRGKPMVLSLVYTSCYEICPMTTRYLADAVDKAREAVGDVSFNAVTLGFDTRTDTPEAMRHFARKQGIMDRGWELLTIGDDDVQRLANDLGFQYFPAPHGFDHLIQATVIDAQGRVYRQVYGQVFDIPLLVEPLIELVLGRPQPNRNVLAELVNKVRLYCTVYDPARDGYYFDYSLFIGIAIGTLIIVLVGAFLTRELLQHRRSVHH